MGFQPLAFEGFQIARKLSPKLGEIGGFPGFLTVEAAVTQRPVKNINLVLDLEHFEIEPLNELLGSRRRGPWRRR